MSSPRRSQLRIAYPGGFETQSDFGVANWLANGTIDALFNLVAGSEPRLEYVTKEDEIFTCTGQDILDELLLARSIRITMDIEIDVETLRGLLGWGFGVISGNDILMLSETEFQPPPTTFIWGHDDAAGTALKLGDMVLEEIVPSAEINGRIRCTVAFRGHGGPTAAGGGYTFPACADANPIRLSDGDFSLDGDSVIEEIRRVEFRFSNRLLFDEDPFTADDIDITRMERADQREALYTFTIYGQPGDARHLQALAKTKMPVAWQIGDNPSVTIAAASAILKQGDGPGHDGEARRSVLGLQARPRKLSGNANTPVKATYAPEES